MSQSFKIFLIIAAIITLVLAFFITKNTLPNRCSSHNQLNRGYDKSACLKDVFCHVQKLDDCQKSGYCGDWTNGGLCVPFYE